MRFASSLNMVCAYSSLAHLWPIWMGSASVRNQRGGCQLGIFVFTCWEVWKARCYAIYENVKMWVDLIYGHVIRVVLDMMSIYIPKTNVGLTDMFGLEL